jgi:hypothetical protein
MKMLRNLFDAPVMPIQESMNEALSCFEILRTVGFTPDEIYFAVVDLDNGQTGIRIQIRRNAKEFIVDLAVTHAESIFLSELWQAVSVKHNAMSEKEGKAWIKKVRDRSLIRTKAVSLFFALESKGFKVGQYV